MGIEGKCSSISFLYSTVVFTLNLYCNFIGSCFYPPFWRPKGCKRHSTEKISHSLLCSRIFAYENIPRSSFACRQLFPQKDYAGVCKFSRATARKKTFTLLSAPFTAAIACDFDSAVFF